MRRAATAKTVKSFLSENAQEFADCVIANGIFEFDPAEDRAIEVENRATLDTIRELIVDFFEGDCHRRTYLVDGIAAQGLPTWKHHRQLHSRCYVTLYLSEVGSLEWRFTWTPGDRPVDEEIPLIDLSFRRCLADWAHTSSSGAPVALTDPR